MRLAVNGQRNHPGHRAGVDAEVLAMRLAVNGQRNQIDGDYVSPRDLPSQ
jgi:hypothetical protein